MRAEQFIERRKKDTLTDHIIKACNERMDSFQQELTRLASELNSVRHNVEVNSNYAISRFDSIDKKMDSIIEESIANREADQKHREAVQLIIDKYVTPVENAAKGVHFVAVRTSSFANLIRRFIMKFIYPIVTLVCMYYAVRGLPIPHWIQIFKDQ